ncbi:hypothetical protein [Rhodococcus opacus]|uniref:hypothetical protein n=1 Tax=Rhodococcus opacus TaxID=37919 RepID=UPI00294B37D1|nr:hypothetical protein [Rhodococcus opacus]
MRINENLVSIEGRTHCVHCNFALGEAGEPALAGALLRRGDVTKAGPQIRSGVPSFVRTPVEFRQYLCPGCFTALLTEVVATEQEATRETVMAHSATPVADD